MNFSEVFSTTGKVLLALLLIGVAVSIVFTIVHGLGSLATESSVSKQNDEWFDRRNREADEKPASMPISKWKGWVADAASNHCAIVGMTKEEVKLALGEPTEVAGSAIGDHWDYISEDKSHCVRYDGDKCAEHPKNKDTVYFTPAGHMKWDHSGAGCYTQPFFGYALHEVL